MICALLVLFTVKDPQRGGMEQATLERRQRHFDDQEDEDGSGGGVALVPMRRDHASHEEDTDDASSSIPLTTMNHRKTTSSSSSHSSNHDTPTAALNPTPAPTTAATTQEGMYQEYFDNVLYNEQSNIQKWFGGMDPSPHVRTMLQLLSTPTVVLALLQGAPGCVPWGILNVFLNDYLSEDKGFSVEMATTTLMIFSLGHVGGLILGGTGGKLLYQRDKRLPALLAGSMAILGCLPFYMLLNNVDVNTPYIYVIFIAATAGFGSGPTGPIIKATMTNVTLPRARGQAFALFNLFDDFGKGLGPYFVSLLIRQMGGRLPAFNVGVLGWVLCGIFNLAIYITVRQDEATVQATVAAQLETMDVSSSSSSSAPLCR